MLILELTKVIKELCYFKTTKNVILLINTVTNNNIQNHLITIYIHLDIMVRGEEKSKNK